MTTEELKEIVETNKEWRINNENNNFEVNLIQKLQEIEVIIKVKSGDIIKYIFNDINYAFAAIESWAYYIKRWALDDENYVILEPSAYWTIYKKVTNGKLLILDTKYQMWVNDEKSRFLRPKEIMNENNRAVYGLFFKGECFYIGSTGDYIERWKQHYIEFQNGTNEMYNQFHNYQEYLEYKVLENIESVEKMLGRSLDKGVRIFEEIERLYIVKLKPPFNKEGVKCDYVYHSKDAPWNKGLRYKELDKIEKGVEKHIKSIKVYKLK